jgi:hypothetical protein
MRIDQHTHLNGSEGRRSPASNRMTEADYERERSELVELYGTGKGSEKAKREQALAKLFYRTGWTQEELAKKEGKKQPYISYQLKFGRFLEFITGSDISRKPIPHNLTEYRFRTHYWERTEKCDGNERIRFQEVLRLMEEETKLVSTPRPSIREALLKEFSDGKWHAHETMAKRLGTTADHVHDSLNDLRKSRRGATVRCERKQVGTSLSERIFPPDPANKQISSVELITKLGPIIEGLIVEGKKDLATFSPNTVRRFAHLLKQQLDEWSQ